MAYMQVVVLTWGIDLDSAEGRSIAGTVRDELIPMLREQPGFVSSKGFAATDEERTAVAVATWESAEQADAGIAKAAAWTEQQAGRYLTGRTVYSGEVILSS
jgi:heme-degrading monooxygenase HmoA